MNGRTARPPAQPPPRGPPVTSLCSSSPCSEYGVWAGRVAAIPPISLSPVPSPELRGALGWRGCRHHPGRGDPEELRAEAAGPVAVVDFWGHVHRLCAVRCLLEHLCLQPAGLKAAAAPLRAWRTSVGEGREKRRRQGAAVFFFSSPAQ